MTKSNVFLVGAAAFLAGVGVGLLASPTKNGIGNNSNSGNNIHYHYGPNCGLAAKEGAELTGEIMAKTNETAAKITEVAKAAAAAD